MLTALTSTGFAATATWQSGGTGNWSVGSNWGGSAPLSGDSIVFGPTSGNTSLNNDLTLTSVGTITFNANAPGYTIAGSAITNASGATIGGFVLNSANNITQTINTDFTILAQNAFNVTGGGNLTLGGAFSKSGTWQPNLTMNGTGVLTLNGATGFNAVTLTANSGTVVLAKTNAAGVGANIIINGGLVTQAAANNTSGTLTMTGGTFDLNGYDTGSSVSGSQSGFQALKGTVGLILNNAAGTGTSNLKLGGTNAAGIVGSFGGTISDGPTAKLALVVSSNSFQSVFQVLTGKNPYSGGTKFVTNSAFPNGSETLSISSVRNIGSPGNRNLTFDAANTVGGSYLQITGTEISNSSAFDSIAFNTGRYAGFDIADSSHTFMLSSAVNSGSGGIFAKKGAGTLVLAAAATYTGATRIEGGSLKVDYQSGGSLNSGSAPSFTGGGTLQLVGKTSGATTQQLSGVSVNAGGGSIVLDANGGAGTTLTLGSLQTFVVGSNLDIKLIGSGNTITTTTTAVTNGLLGNGRVTFRDASGNINFAGISASGGNRIIQAASFVPGLPASGSTSTVNYSQADSASVSVGESINSLKLTTTTTSQSLAITSGEALTITSGGLLFTGADDYSITGGSLKSNTATNSDLIIHQQGSGTLTVGAVVTNGLGASTLTKAGNGTLVLGAANTYGGQTYINGGILSISADSNLNGASGTFAELTSLTSTATVTSTAGALPTGFVVGSTFLGRTVNAISGSPGAYTITLNGNAGTALTAGTASWATAATLNIHNGAFLQSTGTVTLQESNTGGTAGATTVNRSVVIGGGGGGFDVTSGNTLTITGNIAAAGMVTKNGGGTLFLSGTNSLVAGVRINDGVLKLGSAGALDSNGVSALQFATTGAPTLQLNGFNATVTSLTASNTNAIIENASSSANATLTVSNGADNTFTGVLRDGLTGNKTLSLTKAGAGMLTLTGANTNTGRLTVQSGILSIPTINNASASGPLGNNALSVILGNAGAQTATLSYTGITTSSTKKFTLATGGSGGFDVTDSAATLALSGVIDGGGSLTKTGPGTLMLSGNNTYSGNTFATGGTLKLTTINPSNELSTISIAASAVLQLTFVGSDVVEKLFIGATQMPAGTYGHSSTGATNGGLGVAALDANFATGTGTLTVSSGPALVGYSGWQVANGTTQAMDLDHDGDGVSNGIEYFLGGASNTTGVTPLPSVINSGGILSITWTKAASGYAGNYGSEFVVETSPTLAADSWVPEASHGNVTLTGNEVKYTFPAGPVKNFVRLRVTIP